MSFRVSSRPLGLRHGYPLSNSDSEVSSKLKRQNTSCESIPRVYSGVSYNACKMHSNSNSIYLAWVLGFYVFDSVLSTATDTVALPYTIYAQNKRGNLVIE
ncbi:YceK/YidQ family lipoprotein [Microbulbifer halophilus]|uniref:YceK/YidQ family lipoprotein n=1 Tax=Microbulbifer halophilus TaxID=453963 RepID=UPI002AD5B0BC|nr:YceK/YidQ family lipoprotein [Microbulbifer halophilus]